MAKVTIRVKGFTKTLSVAGTDADEAYDNLDAETIGELAIENAEILDGDYDDPIEMDEE